MPAVGYMFALFKRRRENGMADRSGGPPLSADLRAIQDREFADRLNQRLLEKTGLKAGGKLEPIFKTNGAAKQSPTPGPSSQASSAQAPSAPAPAAAKPERAPTPPEPAKPTAPPAANETPSPVSARAPAPIPPTPIRVEPSPLRAAAPMPAPSEEERRQPVPGLPLVMLAAQFAADRHKTQRRRGAAREPYINHLLEVAALLATATEGRDPELVIAGLLHDLIEDQGVGADEIARQFGVGVAALVLEATTDKSLPEAERQRLQVAHAPHKSPRARMLRVADLTSNLRALRQSPPADWSIDRRRDYFLWAHDVAAGSRGLNVDIDNAFDDAYDAGMAALDTAMAAPTG